MHVSGYTRQSLVPIEADRSSGNQNTSEPKENYLANGSDLPVASTPNSDRHITSVEGGATPLETLETTLQKKQQAMKAEANKNFSPITDPSLRGNSYSNPMSDEDLYTYLLAKHQNNEASLDGQCPSNIDDMHSWTIGLLKDIYTY
jgi:hypothetical protein